MNILSIDTSTQKLSLAVSKGEKVLKFRNIKLSRPLSSSIMPGIKKILHDAQVPLAGLDGFAVGLGPGSFTSLRVGLATVKGLAFVTRKPVVGVSSLDVLAMNVCEDDVQVCALCDAKRGLVYACVYDKTAGSLKKKCAYVLTDIQDVLKKLKGEVVFIGDGTGLYKEDIKMAKGIVPRFSGPKDFFPQARALASLALPRLKQKDFDPIDKIVPLYLYPDHCQIKKKQMTDKRTK